MSEARSAEESRLWSAATARSKNELHSAQHDIMGWTSPHPKKSQVFNCIQWGSE